MRSVAGGAYDLESERNGSVRRHPAGVGRCEEGGKGREVRGDEHLPYAEIYPEQEKHL